MVEVWTKDAQDETLVQDGVMWGFLVQAWILAWTFEIWSLSSLVELIGEIQVQAHKMRPTTRKRLSKKPR